MSILIFLLPFFVSVLYIDPWNLFCIAPYIVIALPTIAIARVVAFSHIFLFFLLLPSRATKSDNHCNRDCWQCNNFRDGNQENKQNPVTKKEANNIKR